MRDPILEKIVKEVAKETGYSQDLIWRVYNHYYYFIFKKMTEIKYQYLNFTEKKKQAVNIKIPGLGRFLHKYGRTIVELKNKKNGEDETSTPD